MRFLLVLIFAVLSTPVAAQVHAWPGHEAHPAVVLERHRAVDAAQRARSDDQAAFARQQQIEARRTRLELQAARQARPQPTPSPLDRPAALPSAARNETTRQTVGEIDAWLDRAPE